MKKYTVLFLLLSLLLTGCDTSSATNLMEEVPARVVCLAEQPDCAEEATDFSLRLFRVSLAEEGNTLVSPLSVLAALGMTANGADGETLEQMESAFGMTTQEVNAFIYSFLDGRGDALKLANSIWLTDDNRFRVSQNFLETNADFYQADIFTAPMDGTTLDAINRWVEEKTDGMIPRVLEEIPGSAIAYLVNALAFEAQWPEPYRESAVHESVFTTEAGGEQIVELMYSTESDYLEDDLAEGFLKYYDGRKYAFAALLPREGVSVSEYVQSLTGDHLQSLLAQPQDVTVHAAIPKFETEYSTDLSGVLAELGMVDAFDPIYANLTGIGTLEGGNLYISRVLHKTTITMAEQGTKAGAATVVEMAAGAAYMEDIKTVILNRPFVYLLIDCEENIPFFLGTLMDTAD